MVSTILSSYRNGADKPWELLSPVSLVDVVTGAEVREPTEVKTFWDDDSLHIRFECMDEYAVSSFTERDEPLYEQDVVEVFIDEAGEGTRYLELEVSPNNVVFDAIIENNQGKLAIDTGWNAEGLVTSVRMEGKVRIYELQLPFSNFENRPVDGTMWRINFYRIDEDKAGTRHYQAWSPTGAVNYHIPSRFGEIRFVKDGNN